MPDIQEIYGGFDMNQEMEEMDNKGCCGPAMKVWLIICNVILLLLAVASLGIGIWVQTQPGFAWTAGSVGVGLIIVGVFLLVLGLLGIFAAIKKSKCLFGIYGTLLTIFFIAELAALVVAVAATNIALDVLNQSWGVMTVDQRDGVGMFFGCCGTTEEKYSKDGSTTCLATADNPTGESDPDDKSTHTAGTGICQIFGLDYHNADGEVTHQSFPLYSASFLAGSTNGMSNSVCAVAAPADNTKDTVAMAQCLCELEEGSVYPSKACREQKAQIPLCSAKDLVPFPFVVGTSDQMVNIDGKTVAAPMAACYSKFESWLASNMTTALIIIAFIFIYQIVQLGFTFALCCCCNKKKEDGATATDV